MTISINFYSPKIKRNIFENLTHKTRQKNYIFVIFFPKWCLYWCINSDIKPHHLLPAYSPEWLTKLTRFSPQIHFYAKSKPFFFAHLTLIFLSYPHLSPPVNVTKIIPFRSDFFLSFLACIILLYHICSQQHHKNEKTKTNKPHKTTINSPNR